MGSNLKSYRHRYFVCYTDKNPVLSPQEEEVSDVKWLTLNQVLKYIRPYNFEKKKIIMKLDSVLNNYHFIL